ncbi:hypothetical protein M378DRAFT_955058 [Amanita muscaria Koide BX008]|uniref:Uncharacterized protein n=1 Tax=Amanita muscaria (strain Koide BX008) TaxID=946122 RepID=A0A0C2WTM5_AMAMK|nr:hypothetical protein M378DRAFT_955058 [Amanita muscaria Koide BX008]
MGNYAFLSATGDEVLKSRSVQGFHSALTWLHQIVIWEVPHGPILCHCIQAGSRHIMVWSRGNGGDCVLYCNCSFTRGTSFWIRIQSVQRSFLRVCLHGGLRRHRRNLIFSPTS